MWGGVMRRLHNRQPHGGPGLTRQEAFSFPNRTAYFSSK